MVRDRTSRVRDRKKESGKREAEAATTTTSAQSKINKIYSDPASAGGFSGVDNLYHELRKKHPGITKTDVRKFLEENRTYTLFKQRRVHFKRSKFVPAGFLTDMQVDLGDFQMLARGNGGFRYMLVGVDVLSRRLFTAPVKSKSSGHMIAGFEQIFSQMPYMPQQIFSDRGMEFESKEVRDFFEKKGIEKFKSRASEVKAGVAERMIKTIKQRLYRYFSEKNTTNWIKVLPKITRAINHTKCRITSMRPADITEKNASDVWERVYGNYVRGVDGKRKGSRFSRGDSVRISRAKPIFEKGYLPNFSDEIFTVNKVSRAAPNHYELIDNKGEPIHGRFYQEELVKTREDENTTYRIERIIRKRKTPNKQTMEYLVKFIGYPEQYWIDENDIVS